VIIRQTPRVHARQRDFETILRVQIYRGSL